MPSQFTTSSEKYSTKLNINQEEQRLDIVNNGLAFTGFNVNRRNKQAIIHERVYFQYNVFDVI